MGRPRAFPRGMDEVEQPDWTAEPMEGVTTISWKPAAPGEVDIESLCQTKAPPKSKGKSLQTILAQWPNILKAAENGYEWATIAKAIGVSNTAFNRFIDEFPKARMELIQSRLKPRDLCVKVVLNAAKSGQWLPAAWWLERTCWQEFAKPEVKLQMLDRANNANEVVQTFNGKSLAQINQELREQFNGDPSFQRAIEQVKAQVDEVRAELGDGAGAGPGPEDKPG